MATIRFRSGKYQVQVRRQGHSPLSKSFLLKSDAEAWSRGQEVLLDQGILRDARQLKVYKLSDLIQKYISEELPRKKASTVLIEGVILSALKREPFCQKKLSCLSVRDLNDYRDRRLKLVKPSTLRRELNPLRHLLSVARVSWGIPVPDLFLGLALPPEGKGRQRRLQAGELDQILSEVSPLVQGVVLYALETGARRGEILGAVREDIDIEARLWTIPDSKNGHLRRVPLSLKAVEVLQRTILYPHGSKDKVFPMSPNALRLSFSRALKRAGIKGLTFHDLRHEAISRLFEKGLSVTEVASISGHRDIRMLLRYGHGDKDRILGLLDQAVP